MMKRIDASEFPQLKRALSGYLHEDFLEEYHSPRAALAAFLAEASTGERLRLAREARRFLDLTRDLEFADVVALLHRLGARWQPESREVLAALLSDAI
jgi:hypothetical protein